ncbi:MAG: hypothetical protein FWC15_09310 [Fibromonadales bacterium]|nr:hypothetical protein [Fibromonadales bacterium]
MLRYIFLLFLLLFLIACKKDSPVNTNDTPSATPLFNETLSQPFTDPRDGKQYKTVKTGSVVWLADNLDYDTGDSLSWCYRGDCKKYGRVYTWEKAKSVCPSGWHLPSGSEWAGVDIAIGIAQAQDSYCEDNIRFGNLHNGWWTSTPAERKGICLYDMRTIWDEVFMSSVYDNLGCTVRCLQDNSYSPLDLKDYEKYDMKKYLDKYKSPTDWCRAMEQDTSEISRLANGNADIRNFIAFNYNVLCVNPAEITAYWLNFTTKKYERLFKKPAPQCEHCSDLEMLIILEDAIAANSPEVEIPKKKKEDAALKAKLQKAIADYENKFNIRAPWWYMCSDKEHLERLQKAIETNEADYNYSYGFELLDYRVGMRLAEYERRFKKQAPKRKETNDERWAALVKALKTNKPILTMEEEEERIKDRHSFHFEYENYGITQSVSVSKTSEGAIVKYQLPMLTTTIKNADTLSVNISANEWQNFIDELRQIGVMNWTKSYHEYSNHKEWQIEILLPGVPDSAGFQVFGVSPYPPEWNKFIKLIDGIKKRASQDLERKLKAEYEKRFKKPITEQELSTDAVIFYVYILDNSFSRVAITRTPSGATFYHYNAYPNEGIKLSTADWLDFINGLYGSSFMSWDKEFGKRAKPRERVYSFHLYVHDYISNNINSIFYGNNDNEQPPNWDKFINVMNDVRARAKKDKITKDIESKMKVAYQKKFNKPISDFALYAKSMRFNAYSNKLGQGIYISLNRTATGAHLEYKIDSDNIIFEENISMEEWLDFLNNLQQCSSKGESVNQKNFCCSANMNDSEFFNIHFSNWTLDVKFTSDIDETRLWGKEVCTPKWNEFVKNLGTRGR